MSAEGYWGKNTATIDWCENNYEITYYVAEFWNTISNLVMIVFPLYGVFWSFKHIQFYKNLQRNGSLQLRNQFQVPKCVIFCQLGLMLVGIGSWMFHMTLLYPMQLLDELPMIYGSAILIYSNYDLILSTKDFKDSQSTNPPHRSSIQRFFEYKPVVGGIITLYCLIVTFIYLSVWKNPVFHEAAYGLTVFVILAESLYLIKILSSSKVIYLTSLAYYALGFFFWNLDNNICSYLKASRDFLDSQFGLDGSGNARSVIFNIIVVLLKSIFEFHAWWHLFTGYAAYMTILFIIDLNYELHLKTSKQPKGIRQKGQPVDVKFNNFYYHLTNQLIDVRKKIY